ncbi:MAG: cupin domain-containing protein [Thaumarchaeota archaeon]|jgi:quercetin dioxygenase-like cupin family protein|nr:cupin domain-containing protein [Candidatus Geocrenenecus arthurdayi]MCL7390466.1 cupin domain-containing protein [Candidatus Geocrenenecus arthurdayi]MCL7395915.1 cupin domain-containing protein [Candidatus Geocrenenecus arthurdayi]MCL7401518.1 cupin domain-containing protein [Candidatus Geocrenenecus arthurdayi]MCL7402749.1 cupin domain-containing protein [Candidatus Geocrenenecus arthurdayi]
MVKVWRKASWISIREGISTIPLSYDDNCLLMMFNIKAGAEVPLHSHPQSQYGLIIKGRGYFKTRKDKIEVSEGDSYFIPANEEHGFYAIEEVSVIDVFVPPRTDYINLARRPDIET